MRGTLSSPGVNYYCHDIDGQHPTNTSLVPPPLCPNLFGVVEGEDGDRGLADGEEGWGDL